MKTFTIAVIAGDGVGIEVIPQAKRVGDQLLAVHSVSHAPQSSATKAKTAPRFRVANDLHSLGP
ncbi:hypothetical protein SBA4_830007 [Candidatus Sulfopaludibacter sp. SbA4]|nr:hypothetical protein SBA4_830007 [Candidatus Sulfopaludibacter sp. SbA4]